MAFTEKNVKFIDLIFQARTKPTAMSKECLECGEKIAGRSDKKFCGDYCRNSYNNKQNRDANNLMRNTHNYLRKNYRILMKMNPKGKTTVSKAELIKAGFSFNFITSIYTTKKGAVYYFVYDQGYLPLDDSDKYVLVKREK